VADGGDPEQNADVARLQAWVERRSRDLLWRYGREGEVYASPAESDLIKTHACLRQERRRVDGPALSREAIERDDGRQALIALTSFVFQLPRRPNNRSADSERYQVWTQTLADDLLRKHGRDGHLLFTTPERSAVRVHAYLAGDGAEVTGPEIRHEWIELDSGGRATTELEAFILSLPAGDHTAGDGAT
jgi:hypothetical protein